MSSSSERIFSSESEFQKAVMNSLKSRGYIAIHSGIGSTIDEYIVHTENPFEIVALIDFKHQPSRANGQDDPVNLTSGQAELLSSIWRKRFIFVINTKENKFIVLKNNGIIPLLSDYIDRSTQLKTGNSINLTNSRLNSENTRVYRENGDLLIFDKFGELIEALIKFFESH